MNIRKINNKLLMHEVLNQIEADINDFDFDAFDELMEKLLQSNMNKELFFSFLSDSAQKNIRDGLTVCRY